MLLEHGREFVATDAPLDGDVEALIREARRRTRRRRLRWLGIVAVTAGVGALVYAVLASGGSDVVAGTGSVPFVNVRAFHGHGNLAFVSRGRLWVLDGTAGVKRELPTPRGYQAVSPAFSHDGRWLAYLTESANADVLTPSELWIAHADGSGARKIARVDSLVGWNPQTDTVAVTVGQQVRYAPFGSATALELISPSGPARTLLRAPARPTALGGIDAVLGAVWSPDGHALAVTLGGGQAAEIDAVPVAPGRKPTVWFMTRGSERVSVTGMSGRVPTEVIPDLAGWWRGWGIAFWIFDFGEVHNADSTPLAVVGRPGAQPRLVARTLSSGITDAVAPGGRGRLAIVASTAGFGRTFGVGKAVETCDVVTSACRALPGATVSPAPGAHRAASGSGVSQDPAWSPNGQSLAYVKAPVANTEGWPSDGWFADHALYVWSSQTGATSRIGKVNGAALPIWSGDSRDLLYESGDGLWLMPVATGKPVEIEHPLYSVAEWNTRYSHLANVSYYGQIPWNQQFSWSSP